MYALGGSTLVAVSLFLILYGAYTFAYLFFLTADAMLHEVFKAIIAITLGDYTGMGYGFLLLLGVTLMIVGLGVFDYLTHRKPSDGEE